MTQESDSPAPTKLTSKGEDDPWLRSSERQRARLYALLATGSFGLSSVLIVLMIVLWLPFRNEYFFDASQAVISRLGPFFLPTLLLLFAGFYLTSARYGQRQRFEDRRRQFDYELEIDSRQAELLAQGDSRQAEMWVLTNERLRGYHERAYRQADQSFRNAQWAVIGGFIIVASTAGIAAWKTSLSTPSSIVIGAIGTVGAGLAAYVGRTFLRLQETTASAMRGYFAQPQETFRYLVAERLVDRLPENERTQTIEYLVQAVMLSGLSAEQLGKLLEKSKDEKPESPDKKPDK